MTSQASGFLSTRIWPIILLVFGFILSSLAMVPNAPGEWGRGALTAYVVVLVAMLAGTMASVLGIWTLMVLLLCVLAIVVGGAWGLVCAAIAAAMLFFLCQALGAASLPNYIVPFLIAIALIPAFRVLLF